jgi:peptidoglycan/xylan/chitin deacetylase (PgdA/CDA1 family)
VKGSFFFTGRFYRNNKSIIAQLNKGGHYLGPHSDNHILYNDWNNRDSLLVTHEQFDADMQNNLNTMQHEHVTVHHPQYFIPPYEWWNDTIAAWCNDFDLKLFCFTPGIRTNADYTYPGMGNAYKSSEWILQSLKNQLQQNKNAFNGAIILIHASTDKRRKDKLYNKLNELIDWLKQNGYSFKRIDQLLSADKI